MPSWLLFLPLGVGLLIAALALPLLLRRIKPNNFYGFRTPKTLSDTKIWYEANADSGRVMLIAGLVSALLAATQLLLTHNNALYLHKNAASLVIMGIILIPLLAAIILSFRKLKKL